MIRAVLFDFYDVWLPDTFRIYLDQAMHRGPIVVGELEEIVYEYFHGKVSLGEVANSFRFKLSRPDIFASDFVIDELNISPIETSFLKELHGHFLKLGVLANLGQQEYKILHDFNSRNNLFEIIASPLTLQSESPLLSKEVFAKTLQGIGEPPQSCLVVTAVQNYQDFATELGMSVIAFAGFPALRQELNQRLLLDLK
jgi:FMN phosphatase YigB (HAD superfamily)